ncbi:hypothetical protein K432DRAFT_356818 [Lepidopterella palustris CBS 459.81]|uniref:AAA+ ATPase domain-containing protein n=1 Tax=Lepidopterella palustris CBS 459.81 TaxID=1314670 RepID=A0A8E2E6Q4_9PEZI|nr:hypothetical protein K432DRAFT_356818 [Lepidopterella palustris CBS 459.81]
MSDGNPLATQATYTPGSTDDLPERIRINSHPLLAILSFLSNKDWSMRPRVLLRPFKLLVHFESEIRAYLKKLEDIWSHQPAPQTEGSVARVGSSGSKQADLDEVHSDARASLPIIAPTQNDDEVDSYETLCDLRCLVRFMDKYLVPVSKRFKTASCKKIEFQDLWYLFKPGDEVYAPAPKITTMEINHATSPEKARRLNRYQTSWRVLYVGGGRRALTADEETTPLLESRPHDFTMICYYLDYNGNQFGPTCCNFVIKPFEGSIDITSLEIYPWRFAPKGVAIREKLKKDGELFREFIDTKHLQYDGTSFTHHPCGRPLQVHGAPSHPETIEGQVIVCFEEGAQMDPGWLAPIGFPDELNQFSSEVIESYPTRLWVDRDQSKTTDSWTDMIHADYCIDKLRYTDLVESDPLLRAWEARFLNESNEEDRELREEDLILLPTRILAYVFRERKFALLNLHNLRKCRTDVDGFQNLKLPKGYKKMVKSLVLTHFLKKKASLGWGRHDTLDFDVVYGKSRGLIILLHGVPGVGKTSTAECVAEATGKPLFPITCGDLGLTPERVEKTLRETFHLAQLWDCVLLLDEADIFLAQRTKTDLQRNALVSVFLRVLEYYSGILFLTTNRVGVIDEAFKSRIHVTLLYPELTPKQTQAIWRMNLDRLRKIDRERAERAHDPEMIIDENKIMDFQKRHSEECWKNRRTWNGRQIRNAFQTASALALFDAHQANINRFEGQENADKAVPDLKIEYFEKVDKASSDFDMYISEVAGVGGKNDGDRALARGERADHLRFHRGGPLESQTELRAAPPAGTRRTPSFSQEGFRQQPQPPTYSSVHMHHREQQYGPSPRASSTHFDTVLSNTFDSRGLNGGFYPHSPPKQGSESPIYSTGMPQEMDPRHLARQNSFNEYDEDDD